MILNIFYIGSERSYSVSPRQLPPRLVRVLLVLDPKKMIVLHYIGMDQNYLSNLVAYSGESFTIGHIILPDFHKLLY